MGISFLYYIEEGAGNEDLLKGIQNRVSPRHVVEEHRTLQPPEFSPEHKDLVIDTWKHIEVHVAEVL